MTTLLGGDPDQCWPAIAEEGCNRNRALRLAAVVVLGCRVAAITAVHDRVMFYQLRDSFREERPDFRRFVALLALATALPQLGVPLTRIVFPHSATVLAIAGLMSFLGGPGHVSLTAWFYRDPVARPHLLANPWRYFWIPALLVGGTTAAYCVWGDAEPTRWINLFFSAWLLWHYQRQNWGIHSFIARVSSGESAGRIEELILRLAVVGGFLGAIRAVGFGEGTPVAVYGDICFNLGLAVTLSLPFLIAFAAAKTPSLAGSPLRLGFLIVASAFFLPVFVWPDPERAFLGYALAHGFQYFVFMSYMAASADQDGGTASTTVAGTVAAGRRPGAATLILCVATIGVVLALSGDVPLLKEWNLFPLFGFSLGLTMAHFVVDAGIWRLRDEFPRRYVGAAFPFLGGPSKPPADTV
jgi:hypothetical protein